MDLRREDVLQKLLQILDSHTKIYNALNLDPEQICDSSDGTTEKEETDIIPPLPEDNNIDLEEMPKSIVYEKEDCEQDLTQIQKKESNAFDTPLEEPDTDSMAITQSQDDGVSLVSSKNNRKLLKLNKVPKNDRSIHENHDASATDIEMVGISLTTPQPPNEYSYVRAKMGIPKSNTHVPTLVKQLVQLLRTIDQQIQILPYDLNVVLSQLISLSTRTNFQILKKL